jgi:hypothetical protein
MPYRVKYQVAGDPVFKYSNGFNTQEGAESFADDVADAGGRVICLEMGAYPTAAEQRGRAAAQLREAHLTARQRRRGHLSGGGTSARPISAIRP